MLLSKAKHALMYAAILAAGLGVGRAAPIVIEYFKPAYATGDFQAYYAGTTSKVLLYGTKTCPYCAKTRAYFQEKGIAFADIDVNNDPKGKHDFGALGGATVPVILIGERRLDGFRPDVIDAALKAAHLPIAR
jgi:mycoredoxin